MNCPADSELVHAILDGEEDTEVTSRYHQHLAACSECRERHQFEERLRGMVRQQLSQERAPDPVRERLLKRLTEERRATNTVIPMPAPIAATRSVRSPWWTRGVLAAASIGLISAGAIYTQSPRQAPLAFALADHHRECNHLSHQGGPCPDPTPLAKAKFDSVPELASFPHLQPTDVKVCPLPQGGNALHVVYRDPNQQEVSLLAVPEQQATDLPVQLTESTDRIRPHIVASRDHNVATWKHNGWVFSLVSKMPSSNLEMLAEQGRYNDRGRYTVPVRPAVYTP